MAINPMEREGCWLCTGSGEIEILKALRRVTSS